MAEPIDLDQLEAVVASGSFTSREIARQLGRRHENVSRALRADPRFARVRDGRRHVWGLALDDEPAAEPEPHETEAVPGAAPEEQPDDEPEVVEANPPRDFLDVADLDGAIALVVDEYGEEVVARIRAIPGGHLLGDELDGDGRLVRVFAPGGVVRVLRAA